jgi:hypothetical protein
MSRFDSATSATVAFGAGILLLGSLAGCAAIGDVVSQQHREEFATYEAAADGWVGVGIPDWIPADAVELRNLATNDESVGVIRVVSDSLLAADCVEAARIGIPVLSAEWADLDWSTNGFPDDVARCGVYEVVPTDDGWLGWFNATEAGQTPAG